MGEPHLLGKLQDSEGACLKKKKFRVDGTLDIQGVLWSLHALTHLDTHI